MKIYYHKEEDMYLFTNAKNIFNVEEDEIAAVFNFNKKFWYHFSSLEPGEINEQDIEYRNDLIQISIFDFYDNVDFYTIYQNLNKFYTWLYENSDEEKDIELHEQMIFLFKKIIRIIKMNNL